jgi:hypothetical protein
VLVFRVATTKRSNGGSIPAGPYIGRSHLDFENDMASDHTDECHPSPINDGLGWPTSDEYCGFSAISDLTEWFGGWLGQLSDAGYLMHVYDVPDEHVRQGHYQVLAKLELGTLVRTEPLGAPA